MAKAHVYVRLQLTGSNTDCEAVRTHVTDLRNLVESMGSEWRGDVALQLDETDAPAADLEVAAAEANDGVD